MANKTDKNSYTILFAIVMVVIVGSLLAGFASGLKPRIKANEKFEKQQKVMGNTETMMVCFTISNKTEKHVFVQF